VLSVCPEANAEQERCYPTLAMSQICKRLCYAEHSVAPLKTCSKYFQCPVSLGLRLERKHRSVLTTLQIGPCHFPALGHIGGSVLMMKLKPSLANATTAYLFLISLYVLYVPNSCTSLPNTHQHSSLLASLPYIIYPVMHLFSNDLFM
jgi:hypothetical protein